MSQRDKNKESSLATLAAGHLFFTPEHTPPGWGQDQTFLSKLPGFTKFCDVTYVHKPSVRFYPVKKTGVMAVFTKGAMVEFGLGTVYHSCDLFWSSEIKEIILQVFKEKFRGQRILSSIPRAGATMKITRFVHSFNIHLKENYRYPVRKDGEFVYIDTSSPVPTTRKKNGI